MLANASDQGSNASEDPKERKQLRFKHQQEVSDRYVRKGLAAFQERHNSVFNADAHFKNVREAKTREEKLESFRELQIECLSMAASSLYCLHLTLLLHRVEFNITGRELAFLEAKRPSQETKSEEDESVLSKFLETMHFFEEKGPATIASTIRQTVRGCIERLDLSPQTAVTAATLSSFFREVCRELDTSLLAEERRVPLLLPDESANGGADATETKVKRLLDEARDYVESPHFLNVFKASTDEATERLPKQLLALGDAAAEPLADGTVPLAKLFGSFITFSKNVFDPILAGGLEVTSFSENSLLEKLCKEIYFQDGSL